ncbi:MAG: Fic family protein [Oscillospiraceae bacterium]|jgi:hypothetical protein|nr:Fic family protein [Oscillospiraceae bacterium]
MFSDKYRLTREQSVFLAKKKWDENVYCGMKMENRSVTFPQTKTILDGVNVPSVSLDDIQAILNMRDAWRFLINAWDEPVTLGFLCRLNGFIARNEALEWGRLRNGMVGISGTNYSPPAPIEENARRELSAIIGGEASAAERALAAFCWGARSQLFWDGNKRTSLMLANKILLTSGAGMLTIMETHMERFNVLLTDFYNSGDNVALMAFLYEKALVGIDFGGGFRGLTSDRDSSR